ncbi:TetR/AcrR family transcriptional regulator [Mycolicibacterium sp. XJ870]
MADDDPIPRALEILWHEPAVPRRSSGLSRDRIVNAAIELADTDGLGALSMARLAQRLDCGTMSLYRHVANKDELVTFMVSAAPGQPPKPPPGTDWCVALSNWADGLWGVYHRHPWVLQTASAGPPADPGQLAWLDAGLATLGDTGLTERDKLTAVMAVLHYIRGAAAVALEAKEGFADYTALLQRLLDGSRFPALANALAAGVFDGPEDAPRAEFRSGLQQLLDGIAVKIARSED